MTIRFTLLFQTLAKIRVLVQDSKRLLVGLWAIGRDWGSAEPVSPAISCLSTPTALAQPGVWSQYELVLANPTPQHCWATVRVEIGPKEASRTILGPVVSYEQSVFVRSRTNQSVTFAFDWQSQAVFHIDGIAVAPDRQQGEFHSPPNTYYVVTAILFATEGERSPTETAPAEHVRLIQRLVL